MEGTLRFTRSKPLAAKTLGNSGLHISPIGFGCHRLEDLDDQRNALEVAIKVGCNLIDVAPNYSDGAAERAVGSVLQKMFSSGEVQRDELVIVTKVGNIVGSALELPTAKSCDGVSHVRADVWHCLDPMWIQEELTRSLERMGLECVDVLLLHCPEFASKAPDTSMEEVYRRVGQAFKYLEQEVKKGRLARYGVTAAFYPLRSADPEHLVLDRLLELLPQGHHFGVIQFPLNFAEPHALLSAHAVSGAMSRPSSSKLNYETPPLLALAKKHGLATLVNRPVDGIYKELRGSMRFASQVSLDGELGQEGADELEAKLTAVCAPGLGDVEDPIRGQLAAKTVKVLAALQEVDCVLVGMRRLGHVATIIKLLKTTPSIPPQTAAHAVKRLHETLGMWFFAAEHGDW